MIIKSTADILKPADVRAYFQAKPVVPRLFPLLFPTRLTDGIEFEIIKNTGAKVTMAHVQPFNAPAHKSGRDGVSAVIERMDPIKEGFVLDEKLYREYKKSSVAPAVVRGLFDDIGNSYESIMNRIEMMAMGALSTGVITIDDNKYKRSIDMLVPATNKLTLTGTDKWSVADADIIGDLQDIVALCKYPAGAKILTSKKIVNYMLKNTNIKKLAFGDAGSAFQIMNTVQLNSVLTAFDIPNIATYEGTTYKYDATGKKVEVRFWPDNILTLVPGNVGELAVSDTVEELSGTNLVTVRNKIAVMQYESVDPYNITTVAAALQLPYLTNPDQTFILQPID